VILEFFQQFPIIGEPAAAADGCQYSPWIGGIPGEESSRAPFNKCDGTLQQQNWRILIHGLFPNKTVSGGSGQRFRLRCASIPECEPASIEGAGLSKIPFVYHDAAAW